MEGSNYRYFPRKFTIEITDRVMKRFIMEDPINFLDFLFPAYEYCVKEYLDEHESDFQDFIFSGGANE